MAGQEAILNALKTVQDPELNVNIVDLGLVYTVQSRDDEVDVEMNNRDEEAYWGVARMVTRAAKAVVATTAPRIRIQRRRSIRR